MDPSKKKILGEERIYTHQWHRPNVGGLKNTLRMAEGVAIHFYRDYPHKDEVFIWPEYKGHILDIEKAKMAVRGDFGEGESLDEILEMVVIAGNRDY